MKKMNNLKLRATALGLAAISTFSLAGCNERAASEDYDTISQSIGTGEFNTLTQTLEVPNNNFQLITVYSVNDAAKREWRITSDKSLYLKVYTKGLDPNTKVYIDNIHIDTSIKSDYAIIDGIKQDSMDDHVHSSQMIGFPISDSIFYYGTDTIEGYNQEFIQGSYYAFKGHGSGSIDNKRYTEQDYIDKGVYGNKFSIVYDLLIKKENEDDYSNVSVYTDFVVKINNTKKEKKEIEEAKKKDTGKIKIKTLG